MTKWDSPSTWLDDWLGRQARRHLLAAAYRMAHHLEQDDIKLLFSDWMEQDGFYNETTPANFTDAMTASQIADEFGVNYQTARAAMIRGEFGQTFLSGKTRLASRRAVEAAIAGGWPRGRAKPFDIKKLAKKIDRQEE